MALVDVIIPVFNTPLHFLGEALSSLRQQTQADWVAWVIDDGSESEYTVDLRRVLESYADPRIKYLHCEHKGPAGSRNVGIERGNARYVAFLDSDDCWLPHHLGRQLDRLESDPGISLVHGHSRIIDSQGKVVRSDPPRHGLNDLDAQQCFVTMLRENFINASSVVVRRDMIEKVGGFDGSFPCLVDKELWLRMLDAGAKFCYDQDVVLLYRVHPQNISKKTDLLLATRQRIIAKAEGFVKSNPALASVDWPSLRRDMRRHMYREAADAYFRQGRYSQAIKFAFPNYSGLSWYSLSLTAQALLKLVTTAGRESR